MRQALWQVNPMGADTGSQPIIGPNEQDKPLSKRHSLQAPRDSLSLRRPKSPIDQGLTSPQASGQALNIGGPPGIREDQLPRQGLSTPPSPP